ncbi:MAG: hypothetical protein ABUK16_07055, partial [Anaerolineales bacterium]
MAARTALLILAALALACLPACVQDDGTRFNPIKDMTTVSDDEVFHETVPGHFWYFHYPVIDPKPGEPANVTIATT